MLKYLQNCLLMAAITLLLCTTLTIQAHAATVSGSCGSGLTWSLDTASGLLQIGGSGAMIDDEHPWFEHRADIKSISIGSGVTYIGDRSFGGCYNLQTVTYVQPCKVTAIGDSAFQGCSSLPRLEIPESVTSVGYYAFDGCSGATAVSIPAGLETIRHGMFSFCRSLTSVVIPEGVTRLECNSFYECTNLKLVTLPESLEVIEDLVFVKCAKLETVTVKSKNLTFDAYDDETIFTKCGHEGPGIDVVFTDTVESVPEHFLHDYDGCNNVKSITVGVNVKSVGYFAFYDVDDSTVFYYQGNAPVFERLAMPEDVKIWYYCNTTGWENCVYAVTALHDITGTSYSWAKSGSGWACTATASCKRCSSQAISETKEGVFSEITAATCTKEGSGKYTATFAETAFATQNKMVTIPSTGHTAVVDPMVVPTVGQDGYTEGRHCGVCNVVLTESQPVKTLITSVTVVDGKLILTAEERPYVWIAAYTERGQMAFVRLPEWNGGYEVALPEQASSFQWRAFVLDTIFCPLPGVYELTW